MSPTLFEVVVVIFLLWVSWRMGKLLAPRLVRSFIVFWRGSKPPVNFGSPGPEKNITPPASVSEEPRPNYASPHQ